MAEFPAPEGKSGGPRGFLKGTVKVAGKPVKKVYVIVGGAALTFVGFRWWKSRGAGETSSEAAGVDESSADFLAESGPGSASGGSGGYAEQVVAAQGALTNSAWAQEAVSLLSGVGWESQAVATALGKYLAGTPLTPTEVLIVNAALALNGRPPQGAPVMRFALDTDMADGKHAPDGAASGGADPNEYEVPVGGAPTPRPIAGGIINAPLKTPTVPNAGSAPRRGITATINRNEELGVFQARMFQMHGFTPTLTQLNALNPSKNSKLDNIQNNGRNHTPLDVVIS